MSAVATTVEPVTVRSENAKLLVARMLAEYRATPFEAEPEATTGLVLADALDEEEHPAAARVRWWAATGRRAVLSRLGGSPRRPVAADPWARQAVPDYAQLSFAHNRELRLHNSETFAVRIDPAVVGVFLGWLLAQDNRATDGYALDTVRALHHVVAERELSGLGVVPGPDVTRPVVNLPYFVAERDGLWDPPLAGGYWDAAGAVYGYDGAFLPENHVHPHSWIQALRTTGFHDARKAGRMIVNRINLADAYFKATAPR